MNGRGLDQTASTVHSTEAAKEQLLASAGDVAKMLDVSTRTVWRLLSAGKMPQPVRVGGSVRWRVDEMRCWIDAGCPALEENQR